MPGLGVTVELDLREAISAKDREGLRELFGQHHLLHFVAPNLSSEAQLDLFETFGKAIPAVMDGKLEMYVSNVRSDGYLGNYELEWHIDGSFVPEPYLANCLYAIDVLARKSATRFASAASAYDRLPSALKEKLAYLQVINTNEISTKLGERVATHGPNLVAAAHRFVSHHPVTGIPYIGANKYQTDCVLGQDSTESAALLEEVYGYVYSSEHVYEHWWQNGDCVIWDNLVVHHARGAVLNVGNRTLRRFTSGPASIARQFSEKQRAVMEASLRARVGPDARRRVEEATP